MIPTLCNESLGVKRSLNKTPIEDVDSILQFTFNDNGTARHVIKLLLFHSNTKKMHKEEAIWQQKRPWLNTALVRNTKESLLKDPKSHCFDKKGQTAINNLIRKYCPSPIACIIVRMKLLD